MSSTIAISPPAAATPAAPGATTPNSTPTKAVSKTPARLRFVLILSVISGVVFGLAGLGAGLVQSAATSGVRAAAAQLVGVQNLRNDLVRADAIAANAFLVGGLEPTSSRTEYDTAIQSASALLARLSADNPADASGLSAVSKDVSTYTGLIEQARANNRQGFPVGAAYLSQASTLLRDTTLPRLGMLVTNDADQAAAQYSATANAQALLVVAIVAFLVLAACQLWLARRTHRFLNRPLLGGTIVVLVLGVVGAIVFGTTASTTSDVRKTSYAATLAVSQAYTEASDAKSLESFTLIQRGSGAPIEAQFQVSAGNAKTRLTSAADVGIIDTTLPKDLANWTAEHAKIRKLDDGGNWDGAVALAIETKAGSPNASFTTFADAAQKEVASSADQTDSRLLTAGVLSTVFAWVLLLAGLAAAVLSWRGVSARLEEYR